ncbi:hypothetical protein CSB69_0388 [Morganella morganii]|nr:hypothetical protein CSB69_0388 [Morganella morganii]EMP51018.1 hypothetical protein C790_01707 [Morganella morganii SC01]
MEGVIRCSSRYLLNKFSIKTGFSSLYKIILIKISGPEN